MSSPGTVVIIPAYREQDALPGTLAELGAALPEATIVVVDDGSPDATAQVARRAGAVVVQLPFNLGVGGAVRTGLRYAVEHGACRAVVVDADGQHDPATVRALLAALDDGADMALGSRFGDPTHPYVVGGVRRRAMGSLQRVVHWTTGQHFSDTTSGFRAFGRPVMELLARDYPVEYLADTVEVLVMVCRAGYRVVEVSTPMRPRAAGEPSNRRLRLVVNYLRVLVGILGTASHHRAAPARPANPPRGQT